jgi:hypothetical protein
MLVFAAIKLVIPFFHFRATKYLLYNNGAMMKYFQLQIISLIALSMMIIHFLIGPFIFLLS